MRVRAERDGTKNQVRSKRSKIKFVFMRLTRNSASIVVVNYNINISNTMTVLQSSYLLQTRNLLKHMNVRIIFVTTR